MTNILKIDSEFTWRLFLFMCMAAFIFSTSDSAFASSSSGATTNDAIGQQLCTLVQALSGGVAKAVATVAIMGVAGGLLLGKLNWVTAMTVSVGVIIIFSAGKLVAWISGSSGIDSTTACSTT